jgi:hypothetical protein
MTAGGSRPGSQPPPLSPCIRLCQLDASRRHCIGCWRTPDEIRDWPTMTEGQRRALLAALPGRRPGAPAGS